MPYIPRKPNRLKNYPYNTPGAYHIIICTANRKNYFWEINGSAVLLTTCGQAVDAAIKNIPLHYSMVTVDRYAVMPNHIHLLLNLHESEDNLPNIPRIIGQLKGAVTKALGYSPWQKSYFDHAIRCEDDYKKTWLYIENNPSKWRDDEYFIDITD